MAPPPTTPLLTSREALRLGEGRAAGAQSVECSLDLGRTVSRVGLGTDGWEWAGHHFPYPERLKERTVYFWTGQAFEAVARYGGALFKLVPTDWGAPTFEIDGIKMLPTATVSPYVDAGRKVDFIRPRGKVVLDTCGGLGYFAAWCLEGRADTVLSYEKNAEVLWLRELNPWSPRADSRLRLVHGDVTDAIPALPDSSVDAVLHDPPRFGIAGELYSRDFYGQLARVIKRRGRLFHYTGAPNKVSSGRDLAGEVAVRLADAGFSTERQGDGVVAIRR
jgi:uncharacterized protein